MDALIASGTLAVVVSGWLLCLKWLVDRGVYPNLFQPQNGFPALPPPVNKHFFHPQIQPDHNFDLSEAKPIPYRPFRWGPNYHITMGIRQGDWNNWIEVDDQLQRYHAIKRERYAARGARVVRTMTGRGGIPSGAEPAREAMYELAEFLSRRYPQIYQVTRGPPETEYDEYSWDGNGEIQTIRIVPIGVTYNLEKDDPMMVAGQLVQDDLAILVEGGDGKYYFQAGSICLAGSWRLEDKIGLPLTDIHTTGGVPQYREKLEPSMDRYFTKLQPERLTVRNNYFFQVVDMKFPKPFGDVDEEELSWSHTALGDEDSYVQGGGHSASPRPPTPPTSPIIPDQIFFRSERQTLRRLPRTDAILFTIHTYYESVVKLAAEPGIPGRMASALRSWPEDVAMYKGQARYRDVLLSYLDQVHEAQMAAGLDMRTFHSNYPF